MSAVAFDAAAFPEVPTISLAELLDVAALQTRTDRKYLLPEADLALLTTADPATRVLEIGGLTRHAYSSTYLDTADLAAYHLAAHARARRFKVRQRTYCDSGDAFLEVKTRTQRGQTLKDRLDLAVATGSELRRFAPATVRERTGAEIGVLAPTLDVTYDRATYYLPGSGSRVTIDTDLIWTSTSTGERRTLPGFAVVETKTAGGPCAVDLALWRHGSRPVRLSKYACGLALTTPGLPTNRWHRTLQRLAVA